MAATNKSNDPLTDLLVDARNVDRQAISEALRGRISIDSQSGRPVLMSGYVKLDAKAKVLSVLLARKAAYLLEILDYEPMTNGDVVRETGLPPGTVGPTLKALRERRLVSQEEDRAYLVPNAQLGNVISFINAQTLGRDTK